VFSIRVVCWLKKANAVQKRWNHSRVCLWGAEADSEEQRNRTKSNDNIFSARAVVCRNELESH